MKCDFVVKYQPKIDLLEEKLSYKLRGIFIEISKNYGNQFKELFYQNACKESFIKNNIKFRANMRIPLFSLDTQKIIDYYIPDFIIEEKIIIEIKAQQQILSDHINQLIRYLNLSIYEVGFIVNFGTPRVQIIRRIYTNNRKMHK